MKERWFRSYHNAPSDQKWIVVARLAGEGVTPGHVAAVWWYLMDVASQAKDRGSVAGFDAEICAAAYGWPDSLVVRIGRALRERKLIVDNRLVRWGERQPRREDDSRERVRRHREKTESQTNSVNVTQRNAVKRSVTQFAREATRGDAVGLSLTEEETDKQTERFASPRAHTALRAHLGENGDVVDRMDAVPEQSKTWQPALMGLYGPGGTDRMVWQATAPADEPALLAKAIDRAAGEGRRYNGRFFRRILETVIDERSNNSRGSAGQSGSQARLGQSGQRRNGFGD